MPFEFWYLTIWKCLVYNNTIVDVCLHLQCHPCLGIKPLGDIADFGSVKLNISLAVSQQVYNMAMSIKCSVFYTDGRSSFNHFSFIFFYNKRRFELRLKIFFYLLLFFFTKMTLLFLKIIYCFIEESKMLSVMNYDSYILPFWKWWRWLVELF